jgi:hypothetical protein
VQSFDLDRERTLVILIAEMEATMRVTRSISSDAALGSHGFAGKL